MQAQSIKRRLQDIGGRMGAHVSRGIRNLKRHPNRWVRRGAGAALVIAGLFGFLPVLGFWMVPLGLLILSNENGWLRRARRRIFVAVSSRLRQRRARQG